MLMAGLFDEAIPLLTPATVVAEVWRSPKQARIGQLLKAVEVVSIDFQLARKAGQLLAQSERDNAIDATVAAVTRAGDVILTSDPSDLHHLVATMPVRVLAI